MPGSARRLTGKAVAEDIKADLALRIDRLKSHGVTPSLHLVRIGTSDDDVRYQRTLVRAGESVGVRITVDELAEDVAQDDLEASLQLANDSSCVHGILVFQPLPAHLNTRRVNAMIYPTKDVDGLSPTNQALIYQGSQLGIAPCTASSVVAILKHYDVPLPGARVTIVGRSLVVGKPLAMLLLRENATVTMCHSHTKYLAKCTKDADVVVAAIGRRKLLGAEYFAPGQTVVDVGIHVDDDGSLVGDVDIDEADSIVEAITPAKDGIGSITTMIMLEHLVTATEKLSGFNTTEWRHA